MTSSSQVSDIARPTGEMDRAVARPRRRRWLWIGLGGGAVAAVLVGAIWLLPGDHSIAVKSTEVQVATVTRQPFQDYVPLRAEAAPLVQTFVTAVEGGQVDQVLALDGAEVVAGQPLARLVNPQLRRTVMGQEADIAGKLGDVSSQELTLQRSQSDREHALAQARYELQKARQELAKRQILHDAGIEPDAGLKTYADEAAFNAQRVAAMEADGARESAMAGDARTRIRNLSRRLNEDLSAVETSLDALVVRAPAKGRLTNFLLQPGQALKAGDSVGQVDSEGVYKLTAEVDEFYLGRVAAGQGAIAQAEGRSIPLKVSRVLPQVAQGRFHVEFAFAGPAPALRRGQSLDVRLILGDTHPAVTLPNDAWMETSGGAYAFVLRPGGRQADRRAIVVRRRNPEQVEVAQGLSPGERVVVSSYAGLSPYAHLILR